MPQSFSQKLTKGKIINISSVQAFRQWPNQLVYGAMKSAVTRMTYGIAWELSGHGINCNGIAPGYIDSRLLEQDREAERGKTESHVDETTPWIPNRRIGLPSDIANMQEAVSERREELNLPNCVCEVYMIIRYLLITILCFSAIAYLANEGHGLIAVGVLALWIFLVSVLNLLRQCQHLIPILVCCTDPWLPQD